MSIWFLSTFPPSSGLQSKENTHSLLLRMSVQSKLYQNSLLIFIKTKIKMTNGGLVIANAEPQIVASLWSGDLSVPEQTRKEDVVNSPLLRST